MEGHKARWDLWVGQCTPGYRNGDIGDNLLSRGGPQRAKNTVLYLIARRVGEHGYKPEEVGEPKAATMDGSSSPEEHHPGPPYKCLAVYSMNPSCRAVQL